jgi:BirA family biotin operon repressor/biotin-[acetyl-CoA-carboxylase] ligase
LKPTFLELKNQFFLYKIIALACFDTLADLLDPGQFDIKIKWPNDILVNKKKIAGVLIENNISSSSIASTVAGIGINVNQVDFDGLENATSLKIVTGRDFSVPAILGTLCHRIEHYYLALRQNKLSEISSAYLSKMYGLGMALEFTIGTRRRSLFVKGVTEGGLLKLEDENGHLVEADVKELTWML